MFSNIAWKDYWLFVLIAALVYYNIVMIVYFRKELVGFLQGKLSRKRIPEFGEEDNFLDSELSEVPNANVASPISFDDLQNEIRAKLEKARFAKSIRQEIIMSLQTILHNRHLDEQPGIKEVLNNYIRETCENLCSIHLDEREINQLWVR